jgi:DNA invertase Pin-like site-specific DNA recombinase
LDRVGRRASEVLTLLDRSDIRVVFADSPNASQLQIGILAVVAEEEARAISARTKAALAPAKARGTKLGNPNGARTLALYRATNGNGSACAGAKRSADQFAQEVVRAYVEPMVVQGLSDAAIAAALNEEGVGNTPWREVA